MSPRVGIPLSFVVVVATMALACSEKAERAMTANRAETLSAPAAADSVSISDVRGQEFAAIGGAAKRARVVVGRPAAAAAFGSSPQTPANPPQAVQEIGPGSMLVRVGQASLQVDSLEIGIQRVREVARRTNAVIANTAMAGGKEQTRSASLELRIPSERFDEAVTGLAPIGKLESVNVSVQDVGEEYVDVQARVANARRLEQRLVELLAHRTGKLSDVLNVERELARVREEIERYEGRARYLRARAAVSTLTIAVHEPFPVVAEHPGANPIRDAFIQAWRNLVGVTAGIIASLGVLIPLGVIVLALYLIWRRLPARSFRLSPNTSGEKTA